MCYIYIYIISGPSYKRLLLGGRQQDNKMYTIFEKEDMTNLYSIDMIRKRSWNTISNSHTNKKSNDVCGFKSDRDIYSSSISGRGVECINKIKRFLFSNFDIVIYI